MKTNLEKLQSGQQAFYLGEKVIEWSISTRLPIKSKVFIRTETKRVAYELKSAFNIDPNVSFEEKHELYSLKRRDIVIDNGQAEKKVLWVSDSEVADDTIVILSIRHELNMAGASYTVEELIDQGYKLKRG